MARRKKRPKRRAVGHSDFAGPKGDPKVLQELAAEAAEANKKAEASDKLIDHHLKLIKVAQANFENSKATTAARRKVLNNRFKVAESDGIPKKAMKRALEIEGTPAHKTIEEEQMVGRILRRLEVGIGHQWGLFDSPKMVDEVLPEAAGERAGAAGISADANPHDPGTEKHVKWRAGWGTGQKTITDRMGPSH
jgi:hypothetical protein